MSSVETEDGAENRGNSGSSPGRWEKSRFDRTDWWHIEESNDATIVDRIDAMRASPTIYGISRRIIDGFQVCIACIVYLGGIKPVLAACDGERIFQAHHGAISVGEILPKMYPPISVASFRLQQSKQGRIEGPAPVQ